VWLGLPEDEEKARLAFEKIDYFDSINRSHIREQLGRLGHGGGPANPYKRENKCFQFSQAFRLLIRWYLIGPVHQPIELGRVFAQS
jgi:hypothetical protein